MNVQESMLRTVYLVEVGEYDDRDIAGCYHLEEYAKTVSDAIGASKIITLKVEDAPNLFKIWKSCKIRDKLEIATMETLSTVQFQQYLSSNHSFFRISWRTGYDKRKFGCFYSWGFTKEDCENNMKQGLSECGEYN